MGNKGRVSSSPSGPSFSAEGKFQVSGASSPPEAERLLPWPARWLVFLALAVVALLAIRVIDGHVMEKMPKATTQNLPAR